MVSAATPPATLTIARMRLRADAPDVQIGDPRVAGTLDEFAHLVLDVVVGGVEKDGGGVAHQRP